MMPGSSPLSQTVFVSVLLRLISAAHMMFSYLRGSCQRCAQAAGLWPQTRGRETETGWQVRPLVNWKHLYFTHSFHGGNFQWVIPKERMLRTSLTHCMLVTDLLKWDKYQAAADTHYIRKHFKNSDEKVKQIWITINHVHGFMVAQHSSQILNVEKVQFNRDILETVHLLADCPLVVSPWQSYQERSHSVHLALPPTSLHLLFPSHGD